jgi:tetratricopeptide (TPR) repeat protein
MINLNCHALDMAQQLREALRHHAEGRLAEAEAGYREILLIKAQHPMALGMLALILADGPDEAAAEAALTHHLTLVPDSAPSLLALGRMRAQQGDDLAALGLLRSASEQRCDLAPIQNDIGVCLYDLGRLDEARTALERAVQLDPAYAPAHTNLARALVAQGRFTEAEPVAREALACGAPDAEATEELAGILDSLRRFDEALALRDALSIRAGLQLSGRLDVEAPKVLLLGVVGAGHVPTRYLLDNDQLAIAALNLPSSEDPDAPFGVVDTAVIEAADVVFSALGDIDRDAFGQLDRIERLCARLGKPVINPPIGVRRTGRDAAADLFAGIPGLIVPPVTRTSPGELAAMPIGAPVLVRPAGDHGGENLVRLADEADKQAYLATDPPQGLLTSPFVDTRSPDGLWRKYRLIFVDRQIWPFHLAITEDWLAHYWRAGMSRSAAKRAEEAAFLADWRAVFGPRATAIEEIARRLDLDYGGVDCALTQDGQVVLFEANACILLHLDEVPQLFPYKHLAVPPIREAFTDLVRRRAQKSG